MYLYRKQQKVTGINFKTIWGQRVLDVYANE